MHQVERKEMLHVKAAFGDEPENHLKIWNKIKLTWNWITFTNIRTFKMQMTSNWHLKVNIYINFWCQKDFPHPGCAFVVAMRRSCAGIKNGQSYRVQTMHEPQTPPSDPLLRATDSHILPFGWQTQQFGCWGKNEILNNGR